MVKLLLIQGSLSNRILQMPDNKTEPDTGVCLEPVNTASVVASETRRQRPEQGTPTDYLASSASDDGNQLERTACLRSGLVAVSTPTKARRVEGGSCALGSPRPTRRSRRAMYFRRA